MQARKELQQQIGGVCPLATRDAGVQGCKICAHESARNDTFTFFFMRWVACGTFCACKPIRSLRSKVLDMRSWRLSFATVAGGKCKPWVCTALGASCMLEVSFAAEAITPLMPSEICGGRVHGCYARTTGTYRPYGYLNTSAMEKLASFYGGCKLHRRHSCVWLVGVSHDCSAYAEIKCCGRQGRCRGSVPAGM